MTTIEKVTVLQNGRNIGEHIVVKQDSNNIHVQMNLPNTVSHGSIYVFPKDGTPIKFMAYAGFVTYSINYPVS